jgi:N-acetylglucosamine-6-phosphate deacetylase
MDHMVRVMRKSTSATLCDIFQMASLTPARLTGLEDRIGSLDVGKCADLLILDQNLNLKNVILDGYLVV